MPAVDKVSAVSCVCIFYDDIIGEYLTASFCFGCLVVMLLILKIKKRCVIRLLINKDQIYVDPDVLTEHGAVKIYNG